MKTYPDCYLHVQNLRSGETWIKEIKGKMVLNLETRVKDWLKKEFCGEVVLDGKIMPRLEGEYYAQIITDNRDPDCGICWSSGGFFTMAY